METKEKKILDKAVYNYAAEISPLDGENRILRETVNQLKNELDKVRANPLMVCEVMSLIGKNAIIRIPNGNQFSVNILKGCEKLRPGDVVLAEQKNLTIIKKLKTIKRYNVEKFVIIEKPKTSWGDIGGLSQQIEDIKEVIELPLKKPWLFKKVGIQPPRGVLLYGEPGNGKTLLAKAVASSTNSTFIQIVSSELVQKFIGEGAKLVKEIFQLARNKAPSIIFIDELDALAAKRMEIGTSGEREVNRTFMQLLAEIDGFKHLDNVKIIGATNRKDILDPAIIRPGRLERLIKIPLPKKEGIKAIFKIHTKNMQLDTNINLNKVFNKMENFSGAEIKAVTTEAGYFAIRNNRIKITEKDLLKAVKKVKQEENSSEKDYLRMFG